MSYVKVVNGSASKFPYTIRQLKIDNPNVSFPVTVTDELLADYGVYPVTVAEAPEVPSSPLELIRRKALPELIDGTWTIGWEVYPITQEILDLENDHLAEGARHERYQKLTDTDWTQVSDNTLTDAQRAEWRTYRQALRDITSHANWPRLSEDDWPTEPS